MLHIILSILKLIGIILLALLGIILALLLLVLIAPFSYSFDGKKEQEIQFHAKLTWLFYVFRVRVSFEKKKLDYYIKIFGFQLAGNEEKPKRKKKVRKKRAKKKKKPEKEKTSVEVSPPKQEEKKEEKRKEEPKEPKKIEEKLKKDLTGEKPPEKKEFKKEKKSKPPKEQEERLRQNFSLEQMEGSLQGKKDKEKKRKNVFSIFHAIPNKIVSRVRGISKKIKQIFSVIKNVKHNLNQTIETIQTWFAFLTEEETKKAISHIIKRIKQLSRHLLPRKMKGELEIGVEDPALMGKILAGLGMAMPLYKNRLKIQPHFGVNILEGNLEGKGRIHLIYILYLALRVYMDKYIMGTIKKARAMSNGEKEEGE